MPRVVLQCTFLQPPLGHALPLLCGGCCQVLGPQACCNALQVLQKRLRRLNDDLKREVAAELDGLAAQV